VNCTGERLTATFRSPGHWAALRQASISAHLPSGTMSPLSSATGMNTAGGTTPLTGWRHRANASKPDTALRRKFTIGW
jgi:hypothetical protein